MNKIDKGCGICKHFFYEDTNGYGYCYYKKTKEGTPRHCSSGKKCTRYEHEEVYQSIK